MKYFLTNAPLSIFERGNRIVWEDFGFNPTDIGNAVRAGFQQQSGIDIVSILPIENEAILKEMLGDLIGTTDSFGFSYSIISEEDAIAERNRLQAINEAEVERQRNTPTDEDIFRAQQLLLLTQISLKLGGEKNV